MAQCWERRGCDEEMMSRCPHNIPGEPCPADCRFCEHFLEHGPGVAERTGEVTRQGNPNRFLL